MLSRSIALAAVLLLSVIAGCSSDKPTDPNGSGPPATIGERVVATTSQQGLAAIKIPGKKREFAIDYTVLNLDTQRPVTGIEVHAIALHNGIFIRTEDPSGRHFSTTQYVPYTAFNAAAGPVLSGGASPDVVRAIPVVTIIGFIVAASGIGGAIYEYYSDPPGLDDVLEDDGVVKTCLTGDLNDVLSAFSVSGVKVVSGAIKVFGAPARIRGVTAINLGFTRLDVTKAFNREALAVLVDHHTGLLGTDVQVWCWPKVGNEVIPVISGTITRQPSRFNIDRVIAQPYYPVFPTQAAITTNVGAQWSGAPKFPIRMTLTPVSCYPGWICYVWTKAFSSSANPVSQTFGCWSANPSSRSGSMTFRVELQDADGTTTPPATFNFRCGSPQDQSFSASIVLSGTRPIGGVGGASPAS